MSDPMNEAGAPEQRHVVLRRIVPKRLQPLMRSVNRRWKRRGLNLEEPFYSVYPFTQVEVERLVHLVELARRIEQRGLDGDIVECGVLDGGSAALIGRATAGSNRMIHLFDAWKGLPESDPQDGRAALKWVGDIVGSPRRVERILKKLEVLPSRVVFHKGWFEETFPLARVDQIALLHIDCDFYAPTKLSLATWYPRVVPGGFIQIDDYSSYLGSKNAVDEFIQLHPEVVLRISGEICPSFYIEKQG